MKPIDIEALYRVRARVLARKREEDGDEYDDRYDEVIDAIDALMTECNREDPNTLVRAVLNKHVCDVLVAVINGVLSGGERTDFFSDVNHDFRALVEPKA
ncbi:hypothetical protein ACPWR0_07435 [Pandoraea pneumonica]|uniref:hypothetical protein n=1 Tax=Pandoraea pneumonica TaxID=2508299 RepID=UPI003CECF0E5